MYTTVLAELLIDRGQTDEANQILTAQEATNPGGFYRAEILRLQGELAAEQGSRSATSMFESARAQAATAGALVFELRAALSQFSADTGARPAVAEVLGRLPPGHRSSHADHARRLLGW